MISDVQSILKGDEPREGPSSEGLSKLQAMTGGAKKAPTRKVDNFKKPDGMHRELYNLLTASETKQVASSMPAQIKKGYNVKKAEIGLKAVRKYRWVAFDNEARSDGLRLHHWQRVDKLEDGEPYVFSKLNKVLELEEYTDEDYERLLKTPKWSKEETDYLFDMVKRFDRRWIIIHDRYDNKALGGQNRTIEDMKERFYSIQHEMIIFRDPNANPVCFDAEHERRRKEQLCKQWNRTKEEIEEEEELLKLLRNIEVRKREREKKAQDLQKLISMTEGAPCSPGISGGMSPALGKKRPFRQKGSIGGLGASTAAFNPTDIQLPSIRFSDFKTAGVHLRSHEMKLPTNVGQKKLKNIETALQKYEMEMNPMGGESIIRIYNDFRSQVVMLQELKSTLQTAEFELETLRSKLQESGKSAFDIEPRMRISTIPEGGYDESEMTGEGAPSTSRRLTSYIDASHNSNPVLARRRKQAAPVTPIEVKRPARKS